jgi:hypothetical protein
VTVTVTVRLNGVPVPVELDADMLAAIAAAIPDDERTQCALTLEVLDRQATTTARGVR